MNVFSLGEGLLSDYLDYLGMDIILGVLFLVLHFKGFGGGRGRECEWFANEITFFSC